MLEALARCRRELRKIALADILDRLPGGHPGVEAAWAIVSPTLKNEAVTVVWTREIAAAAAVTRALAHDPVAARMAFKEAYTAILGKARLTTLTPHWIVSLGYDVSGRAAAIEAAVAKGYLTHEDAGRFLPQRDVPLARDTRQLVESVCAGKARS